MPLRSKVDLPRRTRKPRTPGPPV